MNINWRTFDDTKPEDGQECLTIMKHGMISGWYCQKEEHFSGYYWHDLDWLASRWVPIEEVEP